MSAGMWAQRSRYMDMRAAPGRAPLSFDKTAGTVRHFLSKM